MGGVNSHAHIWFKERDKIAVNGSITKTISAWSWATFYEKKSFAYFNSHLELQLKCFSVKPVTMWHSTFRHSFAFNVPKNTTLGSVVACISLSLICSYVLLMM